MSAGEETNILISYTDAFDITEYTISAVQWSCGFGVMGGYTDGTLKPDAEEIVLVFPADSVILFCGILPFGGIL